jgi:hypothetical protein
MNLAFCPFSVLFWISVEFSFADFSSVLCLSLPPSSPAVAARTRLLIAERGLQS